MTKFTIGLATRGDDALIRKCLRDNSIPGSISVTLETEPSFFDSLSVIGVESQVIVSKCDEEVMGLGIRSIKKIYFEGKEKKVGYLSGLRGYSKFRNNVFLSCGFKFLRELDRDDKVPFYLTTIIEDNYDARKILESARAGLPYYFPLDILSTFVIKPKKRKIKRKYEIIKGDEVDLEKIVNFMNVEGSKKNFYPCIEVSDFFTERLRCLNQDDFYLAVNGDEILGIVGRWNQESFKQTRVISYDKLIKFSKPFINISSAFSNIPRLPNEGEKLKYFYCAFPTVKDNDPDVLESLLNEISNDNINFDYFTIGLTKSDPLVESVKSFSGRKYDSIIYLVTFNKTPEDKIYLNERIPYLELATL